MKVGGSDNTGNRTISSTYGLDLDFIAPAKVDLFQTTHNSWNGAYGTANGTSFAAPHAAGVAALLLGEHDPFNNTLYPNKLAPEDVEAIMKKTATAVISDNSVSGNLPVPNEYAGHGRINAGEAVNQVSLPYFIKHWNIPIDLSNATLHAANQNINFPQGIEDMNANEIIGLTDVYKITYSDVLPNIAIHTNLDAWVRNSSSELLGLTNSISLNPAGGVTLDNFDPQTAAYTVTGYLYRTAIYDANNNFLQYKWFPEGVDLLSNTTVGLSIHQFNTVRANESDENTQIQVINVFPNPSTDFLNFTFRSEVKELNLSIIDLSGKLIQSHEFVQSSDFQHKIDISDLAEGIYFCEFIFNGKKVTKKIIKL
jgi:hypothetical protein